MGVVIVLGGGLAGLAYLVGSGDGPSFGQGIGVVELKGVITESESVLKTLVGFRRNKNVKVIILRIDSPGGGVAATQEIYREIERTKKRKKVIASLGNIAASGGLYIAASANKILANPATVTGSIGVIMQMINVEGLLGKIGFRPIVIKSGRYKDIGSATRTMTEDERAILQRTVDQLHQQFVRDLAKGRALDVEKVSKLADGRIFTGEEALSLGLVDELGNFEDAVKMAVKTAGLVGRVRLIYPKKKDIWWKGLLQGESPLNILPEWADQPLRFQYLYLPGL
ncbi:MAG: signal peptide peptidase SppA [Thermodesulfobacteriota bacterium]|nr:signal peptide peptidase SppA [Thermodesulfobacteriota bacterium]